MISGGRMIVITGPQRTDEERGALAEVAGLRGALLTHMHYVEWAAVSVLYALSGWDECPLSMADVVMAEALAIPVYTVP
jgi:hypothetical protein